jgi:hypothetical protein
MKNCAAGKRKIAFLILLLIASPLYSQTSRTLWLFEQLSEAPQATSWEQTRYQVRFSESEYQDVFSVSGSAVSDLRYFELVAMGSQRVFFSKDGSPLFADLSSLQSHLGCEIGRYFIGTNSAYGRIALGYLAFMPVGQSWIRLNLQTGIQSFKTENQSIEFFTGVYFAVPQARRILSINAIATKRVFLSFPEIGLVAKWTTTLSDLSQYQESEYMLFSFGPVFKGTLFRGEWRFSPLWRLWLDRLADSTSGQNYRVESKGIPDFQLSWTLLF